MSLEELTERIAALRAEVNGAATASDMVAYEHLRLALSSLEQAEAQAQLAVYAERRAVASAQLGGRRW